MHTNVVVFNRTHYTQCTTFKRTIVLTPDVSGLVLILTMGVETDDIVWDRCCMRALLVQATENKVCTFCEQVRGGVFKHPTTERILSAEQTMNGLHIDSLKPELQYFAHFMGGGGLD